MEVPQELLDAGEQLDMPPANRHAGHSSGDEHAGLYRQATPPPRHAPQMMERGGASWTSKVVEGDSLELELDLGGGPSLGEGDGATRVISMSDLGILKNARGRQRPQATISTFDPVGSMATEAQISAVGMHQIDDDDFEIEDADILASEHFPRNVYEAELDEFDDETRIAPVGSYDLLDDDLEQTIAPGMGVRPPEVRARIAAVDKARYDAEGPLVGGAAARRRSPMPSSPSYDGVGEATSMMPLSELQEYARNMEQSTLEDSMKESDGAPIPPPASVPPPKPPSASPPPVHRSSPPPDAALSQDDFEDFEDIEEIEEVEEVQVSPATLEEARRTGNLEELAHAMKKKRQERKAARLGNQPSVEESPTETEPEPPSDSNQARIRSIAEKARQRVEQKEKAEEQATLDEPQVPGLALALSKMEQARRLAAEAREMMDEARAMIDGLEEFEAKQEAFEAGEPIDTGSRREARKILELARRMAEVEQNRLPSSTRKTILRTAKELDRHLQDPDGEQAAKVALQLANRLFEVIRRDLRPW